MSGRRPGTLARLTGAVGRLAHPRARAAADPDAEGAEGAPLRRALLRDLPPPATLALLYAAFIVLGAVLLRLPVAHTGGVGWSEALFTSVSAVTVTGLVVVDTGTAFTGFGQAVIAALIQLGGLGLMVFAVLVLSVLGLDLGAVGRGYLREELNQGRAPLRKLGSLRGIVRVVIVAAIVCETVGILVLAWVFVPAFGWGQGMWHAVFHTVSAFNNAGFALFADSLSGWVGDWRVNVFVPAMFILGGLGFIVLGDLWTNRFRWRPLALHSKLMLVGTAVFVLVPWALFALLEWNNPGTLGGRPLGEKVWGAWFQAVTPRTAGFNTLDTAAMGEATAIMTMALMVIGGGPTSTAGGIKLTTFIVAILGAIAFFRRRDRLNAFGRSLGSEEVMKVMALLTVSTVTMFLATFLLAISWQGPFLILLFEVTSAFGTVGLSMGATSQLDAWGRACLITLMFLGRVGPLTLGFFLATRAAPRVRYPAGQVYLG